MTTRMTTTKVAATGTNSAVSASLRQREAALFDRLRELPSLIVAYSGGVDSAYLAWAATQTLERCYQHADPETLESIVLEGRRLRMES